MRLRRSRMAELAESNARVLRALALEAVERVASDVGIASDAVRSAVEIDYGSISVRAVIRALNRLIELGKIDRVLIGGRPRYVARQSKRAPTRKSSGSRRFHPVRAG
jgi:hypothetical protein